MVMSSLELSLLDRDLSLSDCFGKDKLKLKQHQHSTHRFLPDAKLNLTLFNQLDSCLAFLQLS